MLGRLVGRGQRRKQGGERFGTTTLTQLDIKEREPVLKRLQSKAAEDEGDAECSEAPSRKVIRKVFDVRIDGHAQTGDDTGHHTYANRERPGVVKVMDKGATEKGADDIADGPNDGSPELTPGEARAPGGCIVKGRTHAARVSEYLPECNEN